MQDTYIKLDRSLLRHRYFDNVNVLKVWLWCLMKASHTPHKHLVNLQTVELATGQFITGRDAASRDLKMPGSTAWTILKLLEKDGKLCIKSNNKFSIISVVDFDSYQTHRYQSRQLPNNTMPTNRQHLDTNNKGKKGNKETYTAHSASGDAAQADQYLLTKKGRKLTGKRFDTFNEFWNAFDYKKGKAEAADAWYDIPSLTNALVGFIITAAKREAAARPSLLASGKTPKMAQGWLTARRWEDEVLPPSNTAQAQQVYVTDAEKAAIRAARERVANG